MAEQIKGMFNFGKGTKEDEIIVITGAASGIGRVCLQWFARERYHCVGIDKNFGGHEEFKKSLCSNITDWNVSLEDCDVTNYEELHKIIEKYEKKYGYIHCLINNAGEKFSGSIDSQNPSEWVRMIDVNVMGVLNGIRCVTEKMKHHRNGCIINIGDIGGHNGLPNHTVYCATKNALEGATEGIRRELLEHDIKVIAINPGAVETPLFSRSSDKKIESKDCKWRDSLKYGLLQPEDVARCCLFAYQQPKRCLIREILVAPLEQDM